jgi:hypothetical protein
VFAVPHTPTVFTAPAVQSEAAQQPAIGIHMLVPGQRLNPLLQVMSQAPADVQTAEPFAAGAGQDTQLTPQNVVLVSG